MTILSVILCVLASLVLLIAVALLIPLNVSISFKEDFHIKAYFGFIRVYNSEKNEKTAKKETTKQAVKTKPKESKAKQIFKTIKEKKGFVGAVKEILNFLKECLSNTKTLIGNIKINAICLNISYGSFDAAETAINYGTICTAAYPVLAFFDTAKNIAFKKIDIKSDFENQKCEFDFSLKIKAQVVFLLITAFKIYKTYKNFLLRNDIQ